MTPIILESPTPPSPSPSPGVSREGLVLDGLDLNDGATRSLVGFDHAPAKKLLDWVRNSDTDGAKLLRLARHENSEFDLRIFIRNSTRDLVADTVGGIIDKLQEAERVAANGGRGLALVWTPAGGTYNYTFYVMSGEASVDRAHDFYKLGKPFLDVKLYCSPFGYGGEVTTSTTTSSLPLLEKTIVDIPGDVPAEGSYTVTDAATQNQSDVIVGQENYYYNAAALLIDSASMVTSGFAGSTTTRTGGYSADGVVRATLGEAAVTVCSSGELTHVGSYRPWFRLYGSSDDISVRLAWRQGRNQWTVEPWRTLPVGAKWCGVDLGEPKIREVLRGTQTWQWRVEAKSTVAGDTLDVDFVALVPTTEGYGRARLTLPIETPTTFSARDEFDQSAGALTGKTAPAGGVWVGAGDADDFSVETTGKTAQRTAVSDADANTGRYAVSGVSAFAAQVVQVDHKRGTVAGPSAEILTSGVLARYTDTSNYLLAAVEVTNTASAEATYMVVKKRVTGTVTELARVPLDGETRSTTSGQRWWTSTFHTLTAMVDAAGRYWVWWGTTGGPLTLIVTGQDSALATGGALASGKPGVYDAKQGSAAVTRNYDNFLSYAPTADAVIFSGQSGEFRSYGDDPYLREDSTGNYWGRPTADIRGGRLWLPCAGVEDRTTRVAVIAARNDLDTHAWENISDSKTLAISYRPRWVVVPRQA